MDEDLEPGLGGDLRDAGAHRPGAQDADLLDVPELALRHGFLATHEAWIALFRERGDALRVVIRPPGELLQGGLQRQPFGIARSVGLVDQPLGQTDGARSGLPPNVDRRRLRGKRAGRLEPRH